MNCSCLSYENDLDDQVLESPKSSRYKDIYFGLKDRDEKASLDKWRLDVTAESQQSQAESLFVNLSCRWRRETAIYSSVTKIAMHPAYQRIIGMGPNAIPFILRELQQEPDHWFWALNAITGENPVAPEDAGDIVKMTAAWLEYGKRHGYANG